MNNTININTEFELLQSIEEKPVKRVPVLAKNIESFNYEKRFFDGERGLREIFIEINKETLKYHKEEENWFRYNNKTGLWESCKTAVKAFDAVTDRIKRYIEENSKDMPESTLNAAKKALNESKKSAVGKKVSNDAKEFLLVDDNDFDTDTYKLHCKNGVVDLKTGKLLNHKPEYKFTMTTGVDYDENAPDADFFLDLLKKIHKKNPENIEALLTELGRSLLGVNQLNHCLIAQGGGGNGKSTLLLCLKEALGSYCAILSNTALTINYNKNSFNDSIHNNRKARLFLLSEPTKGTLDEELLKTLTGDRTITTRACGKSGLTWKIKANLMMFINNMPAFESDGEAIKRRLVIFPMNENLSQLSNRLTLDQCENKVREEKANILAMLIRYCVKAQKLNKPIFTDDMIQAKNKILEQQDSVSLFIDECCEIGKNNKYLRSSIYPDYSEFCKIKKIPVILTKKIFFEKFLARPEFRAQKMSEWHIMGVKAHE